MRLLARRNDTDDALFALAGGAVAEVRMTRHKSAGPDPRWPRTAIFECMNDWATHSMVPLHAELPATCGYGEHI